MVSELAISISLAISKSNIRQILYGVSYIKYLKTEMILGCCQYRLIFKILVMFLPNVNRAML